MVGDVIRRAARRCPDRVAVSLGEQSMTFAGWDAAANRMADLLRQRGVEYGDRVGWRGETAMGVAMLFVALARLGAVFVPLNSQLSEAELEPVLAKARLHHLLTTSEVDDLAGAADAGESAGSVDSAASGVLEPRLAEGDPHVIFFTSGSTGTPKGVVLSHRANVLRSWAGIVPAPPGATVCMFPLFHMAPWSLGLGCWQSCQQVAFVRSAEPSELLGAVARWQATRLYAIPAVWGRILAAGVEGWDVSSLREVDSGTSATPPELIAALKDAFPGTITRLFYGSTEAGPGTCLTDADVRARPGSVGLPSPGVEVRLAESNEVCLRSEFLMDGYFEDPTATAAALVDGWYHSGDAGSFDRDGYLSITGRLRDVVRTGGETVAPTEVEAVLRDHPAVADVAVVGLPDPAWGEVVCAVVVVRPGASLDLAGVRAHCEGRLAAFKYPRRVATVAALPRTAATGQVQRTLLVERVLAGSDVQPGRT